jgi:4-hydroxybenzoate polyprenyltransferase
VFAALRILWQSFAYRIRMREANNLAVSVSMMLAFGLPVPDLLYRTAYALLLNVYVYLINDYCDIQVDLAAGSRDQDQVRYMSQHRGSALGALLGLGLTLLVAALVHAWLRRASGPALGYAEAAAPHFTSWTLPTAFVANTILITGYSAWLKRVPFVDLLLMALAGGSMTIVGLPGRPLGWKLIGLLCLLSAGYQAIQVIRDEPADRQHGVRTTAVLLGADRAAWIFRGIMLGAACYGWLVIGSPVPLGLLLVLPLPLSPGRAARTWDMVRLIGGLVWLGLLLQIFLGKL